MSTIPRLNGLYFFAYAAVAFNVLYLNLFLKRNGFSGAEIGTLGAILNVSAVFIVPAIGQRFDRAGRPARALVALSVASGVFFACYMLPLSFAALIAVTLFLAVAWTPVQPFINSLVLDEIAGDRRSPAYGEYRKWGSLGFAAAGGIAGVLTRQWGLEVIFPAYLIATVAIAFIAFPLQSRAQAKIPAVSGRTSYVRELLRSRAFVTVMLVNLLLVMGHLMGWTLRGIYLDSIGISDYHAGLMIVAPTLTEIVVFANGARLMKLLGIRNLVLIGATLTSVRWVTLASVTDPTLLYFTEISHGIGFPMFIVGIIEYLRRTIPSRNSATAQVLVFSSAHGIGAAAGSWISGILLDRFGARLPLYTGAAVTALSGLVHLIFLKDPPDSKPSA